MLGPDRGRVRYFKSLEDVPGLSEDERDELEPVSRTYPFRSNDYYLGLIDWDDPNDPIKRIVIPCIDELDDGGPLDPSEEKSNYVAKGVQHKYSPTALFLVSRVCSGICRFCFRKRLFKASRKEASLDISEGLEYVSQQDEIDNVLLSGGDPLILSTKRLERILTSFRRIPHVKTIRIGTKMPAYNPYRITEDPRLLRVLSEHSNPRKRIYIITHFNHPRELTHQAVRAIALLQGSGVLLANQTPLIQGVNDDPDTISELFNRLSYHGVTPYYLFQCRPTRGNRCFSVPITKGYGIFEEAKKTMSGLAKRARYVMSHTSGKVEILGLDEDSIYLKYHQARDPEDIGRFFSAPRAEDTLWLDDLELEDVDTSDEMHDFAEIES
ncbi:MAG: KamA family radical SAM protein [Thermoplasmata archaeon]